MFGRRVESYFGRRLTPREPIGLGAAILTLKRSVRATVVDVSSTGARLSGCGNVTIGEDLWIKVGVIDCLAKVAWTERELCGIAFDAPLDDEDLDHLRREARHLLVMRITPDERFAAQDWIDGIAR